ncbi:MAG TPA: HAD family phosphatase [Gaiellaceae bacterium]|nr:HAD family phosphatase [Gaiellaceae bacterium]
MPVRALLFDFNGTLSDDEWVQCDAYRRLFAEQGRPLSTERYYAELAGLPDDEIVARWLGPDHPARAQVLADRIRLVREQTSDGSSVPGHVREAVRWASERARLAVVSGASRLEVEPVLHAAELDVFDAVVTMEDVRRGKPDPEGYTRALGLLGAAPSEAVAIEDTEAGVASARAAGIRTVGLVGTMSPERLAAADELADRLDAELLERLLTGPRGRGRRDAVQT